MLDLEVYFTTNVLFILNKDHCRFSILTLWEPGYDIFVLWFQP